MERLALLALGLDMHEFRPAPAPSLAQLCGDFLELGAVALHGEHFLLRIEPRGQLGEVALDRRAPPFRGRPVI